MKVIVIGIGETETSKGKDFRPAWTAEHRWYAPGIGLVKRTAGENTNSASRLRDYAIQDIELVHFQTKPTEELKGAEKQRAIEITEERAREIVAAKEKRERFESSRTPTKSLGLFSVLNNKKELNLELTDVSLKGLRVDRSVKVTGDEGDRLSLCLLREYKGTFASKGFEYRGQYVIRLYFYGISEISLNFPNRERGQAFATAVNAATKAWNEQYSGLRKRNKCPMQ